MALELGFAAVLIVALIWTVLTIIRQSKFSIIYATFGMVFWFALALIHLAVFATDPALIPLAWLWFAVAFLTEVIGLVISIKAVQTDREARDLQL